MGFEEDVERRRSDIANEALADAGRERSRESAVAGHARVLRDEFTALARYVATRLPLTTKSCPIEGARWGRKGMSPDGYLIAGELSDLLLPDGRVWSSGSRSIVDFESGLSHGSLTLFGYTIQAFGDEPDAIHARIHVFDMDPPWLTIHEMCVELAARAVG